MSRESLKSSRILCASKKLNERGNIENATGGRPTISLKRFARRAGEVLNERQESEVGGNRENNKKWTGRKKPAGRNRRMSEKREGGQGEASLCGTS